MYHVINRGNYRDWVLEDDGAKKAFEKALFEACDEGITVPGIVPGHFDAPPPSVQKR